MSRHVPERNANCLSLSRLIELSRSVKMTDEQWAEQRRGFAFGNVAMSNPNVTREMVDNAADAIQAGNGSCQ